MSSWRAGCSGTGTSGSEERAGETVAREGGDAPRLDSHAWLACNCSKSAVAELMRIAWRSVGSILERVCAEARRRHDLLDGLRRIGIDEISHKKGHRYLTVVVDHHTGRLVWAAAGRDRKTVLAFFDALGEERCKQIELVSCDMASWIAGPVAERCPDAVRCVDPFHVIQLATDALDEVRREVWNEARRHGNMELARDLKGARFCIWKNPENLTDRQAVKLAEIQKTNGPLYRAYLLKEQLRQIYRVSPRTAEQLLDSWLAWARRSRLPSFVKLAKTIAAQRSGIMAAVKNGLSNECLSYCTSWWGCGGDGRGSGAGAMMTGRGDGVSGRGFWGGGGRRGAGLAGVVEVGAAAVDPPAGDVPSSVPDLQCLGADAELRGDLFECEHARCAESLVVGGDATVAAQLGERHDSEWVTPAAGQAPLVEDLLDRFVVGVLVEQLVDQRDRGRRRGVRLPGTQRPGNAQRVR